MRSRLLFLCLSLFMVQYASSQKFTVANADGAKIKYEVTSVSDKTVQVTGGDRPDELIIPATVEYNGVTYRVTEIKRKAYFNRTKAGTNYMKRLVMSEGLENIGEDAFHGALKKNVASISIPNSVYYIGGDAFIYEDGWGPSICNYKIEHIPSFINTSNCFNIGISDKSISIYYAQHPRQENLPQASNNYAQSTTAPNVNTTISNTNTAPKQIPSDVDVNLPTSNADNSKTFAIIIGNEKYIQVSEVPYAANDAKIFAEYCQKTLGLPVVNIRMYDNATFGTMVSAMEDIKRIADVYNGDIKVIFYYAGHGVPNEATKDAFLLPVDANGQNTDVCYPVSRLYKELGELGAKNVTVFMDACFSGSQRGEGMLASARGVALKAKASAPKGNMVVFSAATGDETAFPYREKGHGLFTYFLLKKLRDTKGDCTLGELGEYIQTNVRQQSVVVNRKSQTPTVVPSTTIAGNWKGIKLK